MGLFHSLILLYFCTKHSIYKIITYIFEKLYFYLKDEKTCRCFKVFRFQQKIWIYFHKIQRVYIRSVLFISKRPPSLPIATGWIQKYPMIKCILKNWWTVKWNLKKFRENRKSNYPESQSYGAVKWKTSRCSQRDRI